MAPTLTLPKMNDDDALEEILAWLRDNRGLSAYMGDEDNPKTGHDLYVPTLVTAILKKRRMEEVLRPNGARYAFLDPTPNSAPFYAAAWGLCRRGVLYPAPIPHDWRNPTRALVAGAAFFVTEYGKGWLAGTEGQTVPPENGRFGQLLDSHSPRFGLGYRARSREALTCYRAQAYLACCAMCGAAAESIVLALASERKGDPAEILKTYGASGGRKRVEGIIKFGRTSVVQRDIETFTMLLSYWRDDAAHGKDSALGEDEAFLATILLLRFAQFADSRWDELTIP